MSAYQRFVYDIEKYPKKSLHIVFIMIIFAAVSLTIKIEMVHLTKYNTVSFWALSDIETLMGCAISKNTVL